jgi:hypothetical protein
LHETVAVPDPVRLLGVIAPHASPDGTVSVRLTIPAKWLIALIVMVDAAEEPALTGEGDDITIPKSWIWKIGVAVWTSEPLVPVIVSV